MRLELDHENKRLLCLKEAVFYALYMSELPDEYEDELEAKAISESFECGFEVTEHTVIEDAGYVDAVFTPYKVSTFKATMYHEYFNGWSIEVRYVSGDALEYRFVNATTGPEEVHAANARLNRSGHKELVTHKGGILPLWTSKSCIWHAIK